jgi:hypothetical protein
MRGLSSALVLLSGCILVATALVVEHALLAPSGVGAIGFVVGLVGLSGWVVAFLKDGRHA